VEAVRINEEAVAIAGERYRRGLTTFLDVLTTQQALYSAQSNLSQSDANQLIDLIFLYKALGGGWDLADQG
jgi:outer membrane protein TolC